MLKETKTRKTSQRLGRPPKGTEEESLIRILDIASKRFLADGYAATSIDGVTAAAGVSKTTFYGRFNNKAELLTAVVHRWVTQDDALPVQELGEDAPIRERLQSIASVMLKRSLTPEFIAFTRIISTEAVRFPELVQIHEQLGQTYGVQALRDCLALGIDRGELDLDDVGFATDYFLSIAIRNPVRKAALAMEEPGFGPKQRTHLEQAIDLFLKGAMPRKG